MTEQHLEDVFRDTQTWARETFPASTWRAKALHLIEEAVEVFMADPDRPTLDMSAYVAETDLLVRTVLAAHEHAVRHPSSRPAEEIADVALIAAHLFHNASADPMQEITRKLAIIKQRTYASPDENGVVHRVGR